MTYQYNSQEEELIRSAKKLAIQIKEYSVEVDEKAEFPVRSMQLLRENGFMGVLIPQVYGGPEISLQAFSKLCEIISGACLSTGMLWGMHTQQTAIINNYASESLKIRLFSRIVAGELYIASVTSSKVKSSSIFSSESAIVPEKNGIRIIREAPTVSGAAYSDGFLITIKEDLLKPHLLFVFAEKNQVKIEISQTWDSMGMRGTQSCQISLNGIVENDQILHANGGFEEIIERCMAPVGHLAWASCWLGATKVVYSDFIKLVRNPKMRNIYNLESDLLRNRIARCRLQIDNVECYLNYFIIDYLNLINNSSDTRSVTKNTRFSIRVNNLKILSSEILGECIDDLLQLSGLKYGYLKKNEYGVERVYRDIRSARLMINNSVLLNINGVLSLIEKFT